MGRGQKKNGEMIKYSSAKFSRSQLGPASQPTRSPPNFSPLISASGLATPKTIPEPCFAFFAFFYPPLGGF